ncbi:HFL289Wp [Eremothecium sinecaudum]|uniref:HFL289Wp n=1 Tax=Eremothecium sinecaudum TaxID=45286 RepID=A0A0X8HU91_9SACH|nr:HFL289Wp [Eremothecium sinecaudum]AMD21567.1 HFL289Wp [Eremothecium sinecaudum]
MASSISTASLYPRRKYRMLMFGCLVLVLFSILPAINVNNAEVILDAKLRDLTADWGNDKTVEVPKAEDGCPDYAEYSRTPHHDREGPETPLKLPYQRPLEKCRTFRSPVIDNFIKNFVPMLQDPDLAIIFENAFPNTLDTTILWHVEGEQNQFHKESHVTYRNNIPETFIVTGDIHAEWLRDSAWQLSVYHRFLKGDPKLRELILGAINTQSHFIISNPYCNAFQPPKYSNVDRVNSTIDQVFPKPNWDEVFECKYEIDSLASFLTLSYGYYNGVANEDKFRFITSDWLLAVQSLINVLRRESVPTFAADGTVNPYMYSFKRKTTIGSETLPLGGVGNPVNSNTGLIRSAFRPSDDATVFQFFIAGNAHMAVELDHLVTILKAYTTESKSNEEPSSGFSNIYNIPIATLISDAEKLSAQIKTGIKEHGIVKHPLFGQVYAYEVDGYDSRIIMDDANIPSLLSLPALGFVDAKDKIYQNTRKMILSSQHNPYYINGKFFEGIGGPHIGVESPWPMSLLVRIRTSNDDQEIKECLKYVLESTGGLGLIHESINAFVENGKEYTRPWFAWANSEFAKTILQLAETKPHLVLREDVARKKFDLDAMIADAKEAAGI